MARCLPCPEGVREDVCRGSTTVLTVPSSDNIERRGIHSPSNHPAIPAAVPNDPQGGEGKVYEVSGGTWLWLGCGFTQLAASFRGASVASDISVTP